MPVVDNVEVFQLHSTTGRGVVSTRVMDAPAFGLLTLIWLASRLIGAALDPLVVPYVREIAAPAESESIW